MAPNWDYARRVNRGKQRRFEGEKTYKVCSAYSSALTSWVCPEQFSRVARWPRADVHSSSQLHNSLAYNASNHQKALKAKKGCFPASKSSML
jgi:hypothetical protein